MLKLETYPLQWIVTPGGHERNGVISYDGGNILFLNDTETEGYYYVGAGFFISAGSTPMRRIIWNCLLSHDKVYLMQEEPQFYA